MTKVKTAKAVTGAVAQEQASEEIKETVITRERKDLGFVDYAKSRDTILEGRFVLRGILVGPEKKRHWVVQAIKPDGNPGKWIAYLGDRKDGKGVYCRSEIKSICSEFKKAEAKEAIPV